MKIRPALALSAAALAVGALAGCAPAATKPAASASSASPSPGSSAHADWSYRGANGPEHWGAFGAACENVDSSHESPIAIDTSSVQTGTADQRVVTHYTAAAFDIENNGHTIEAIPEDTAANSVEVDGKRYDLQQFHLHASSEHTIDGRTAPAELHLVHKADDGSMLVLGVMLQAGPENTALDEFFSSITTTVSEKGTPLRHEIDPTALIPADGLSVQYDGSLTTPPCTEGVRWNVYLNPVTVSSEELAAFTDVYPDNHRPVQPLHDRVLTEIPSGA
ncbi:carbonic anhydrase [Microbacterium paraoxydans]|uniref:carbonic anhydrase n=1 Tax=Microbacterium paraoxydans TaxID=199592 RepID=A0ABS5IR65_9MICO|nr:carbonic anhydrase family protein [Microbacterium paraoxydans]MBS0025447.1 carbonic anhydrase family protein [Microbacterium paraoxydans]